MNSCHIYIANNIGLLTGSYRCVMDSNRESFKLLEPNSEQTDYHSDCWCSKKKTSDRYNCSLQHGIGRLSILFLVCLSSIGYYYCQDTPAALEEIIIEVMEVDVTEYSLLYTLYSTPNILTGLVIGILTDKVLGLRTTYIAMLIVVCLGQLVTGIGCIVNQYWIMVLGRFVLGAGAQSVMLTVDVFAGDIYDKDKISFAFGLVYAVCALTESTSFSLSYELYAKLSFLDNHKIRLGAVFLFGFCLCLISLIFGVVATLLHYRRNHHSRTKRKKRRGFSLRDIKDFSLGFWLFVLASALFLTSIYSFLPTLQHFLQQKYSYTGLKADFVSTVTFAVCAIGYPFVGIFIDWTGYKMSWSVLVFVLAITSHCLYAFSGPHFIIPFICNALFGLSLILFNCSLWTFAFLLVPHHQTATAYGVCYAVYNLLGAATQIMIGEIMDSMGYFTVHIVSCCAVALGLLLTIGLFITDYFLERKKLNHPGKMCHRMFYK